MSKLLAVAQFETTLASGITSTATTATLTSNITGDQDAAVLPSGDHGFVIDEANGYREFCIATVSGTGLTFVKRGLSVIDGDTVKTGNKYAHRKGASIKIVSFPILTRMLGQINGDLSLDGIPKLPASRTINNVRQLIDKEYADSIVSSGITSLKVTDNGGITININSGYYSLNGVVTFYAGASAQALTDNATNYVELVDGVLSINTTDFSSDAMPLAKVITLSADITSLTDARAILGWLDIKASSGIGRDSSGIYVNIVADKGLEFSGGKLQAKAGNCIVIDQYGIQVAVGITAYAVVQLDANAKLPAVDGSNLLNMGLDYLMGVGKSSKSYYNYRIPFINYNAGYPVIYAAIWSLNSATLVNYFNYATTTSTSSSSYVQAPVVDSIGTQLNFGSKKIVAEFDAKLNSVGTNNVLFGISDSTSIYQAYNDATYKSCMFTVDNSGNLYAHTANAGGGANHTEVQITGITLTNKNTYRIEYNPGVNALFYVNGVLKATITTNLPSSTAIIFGWGATNSTNYVSAISSPLLAVEK